MSLYCYVNSFTFQWELSPPNPLCYAITRKICIQSAPECLAVFPTPFRNTMTNFRANGSAVVEKNGNKHTYIHTDIEKYNIGWRHMTQVDPVVMLMDFRTFWWSLNTFPWRSLFRNLAKHLGKCYWNTFAKFSRAFRTFYDDVISDVIASEIWSQIDQKHPP